MYKLSVKSLNECFNLDGDDFIWMDDSDIEPFAVSSLPRAPRLSMLGYKHSEETKRKISAIHKGNKYSVGRVLSEETKRKIGDANRGNTWNRGRKQNPESVEKSKATKRAKGIGIGAKNPRAKSWQITFDCGKIIVVKSLQTWAVENGYKPTSLRRFYNGTGIKKFGNIVDIAPLQ